MSRGSRTHRIVPWVAVALFGTVAGLLFAMVLAAVSEPERVLVRAAVPASESSSVAGVSGPSSMASTSGSTGMVAAPVPVQVDAPTEQSNVAGPPPVVPSGLGLRLKIPALGLDAPLVELGLNTEGQLEVPRDGQSVGWYDVSSRPGEPGTSLLGGHYDWDGSVAVFWRLHDLEAGDQVTLETDAGGELVYEVRSTSRVAWDAPLSDILASDGGSSLTLFTCGGEFDRSRGGYDERVVVRAELVGPGPQAARR